jgi:hypothetical protein
MADLVLKARWDGKGVDRGLQQTQTKVNTFKASLARIGPLAGAAFGFAGVAGAVQVARAGLTGLVDDMTATANLMQVVERAGGASADALLDMDKAITRLTIDTVQGDTEISDALSNLISLTGDIEGATKNLNLVLDIAADRRMSLADASRLVAFVMKGELEQAGRLIPALREVARQNRDLQGTAEGAQIGINALVGQFGGAAEGQRDTAAGGIAQFKKGLAELNEELIRGATGGLSFAESLGKIGDEAYKLAHSSEFKTLAETIGNIFRGGPLGELLNPPNLAAGDLPPETGAALRPTLKELMAGREAAAEANARAVGAMGDQGDRATARFAQQQLFGRAFGQELKQRGEQEPLILDLLGLPADRSKNPVAERLFAEMEAANDQLRGQIAGTIEGGILAGARNGAQGLKDYIVAALQELAAKQIATGIASLLIPGGGGGLLGSLFGSASGGTGVANARARGAEITGLRRSVARG